MKTNALIMILLILGACSSRVARKQKVPSNSPGSIQSLENNIASTEENKLWAQDFLKAKLLAKKGGQTNHQQSCELFFKLINDDDFPLRDLAYIRSLDVCTYTPIELSKQWDQKELKPWLHEIFIKTALKIAKKKELIRYEAKFTFELSKFRNPKSEKIKFVERAIQLAKSFKDENLIESFETRLYKLSPAQKKIVSHSNIYHIARDYERRRYFKKARTLYLKIIRSKKYSSRKKIKAWNRIAMSYKLQRKKKRYRATLTKISHYLKNISFRNRENKIFLGEWNNAVIKEARAIWTGQNLNKAKLLLENLISEPLATPTVEARIYWILGLMNLEKNKIKDAIAYIEKGVQLDIEDKELAQQLKWLLAWTYYLNGKHELAITAFDDFKESVDSRSVHAKIDFWKAKTLKSLGRFQEANRLLEGIIEISPYSYYAGISYQELHIPIPPFRPSQKIEPIELPLFEWLIGLNEIPVSKAYLKYVTKDLDPIDKVEYFPHYKRANWYDGPIHIFFKLTDEQKQEVMEKNLEIIYPRPHLAYASKMSLRHKVPKELTYSIIRQESAFNTMARSWADAFGLMQLIPEVAKKLSKKYGVKYRKPEDLYRPSTNLFLGNAMLKQVLKSHHNRMIFAIASYNASDSAVRRWKLKRFKNPCQGKGVCDSEYFNDKILEFIENIPYSETKTYVKLVFRNYLNYLRLAEKKPFYFPKKKFFGPEA